MTFQENVELLPFNTFGIRATARYFVSIRSATDLQQLLSSDLFRTEKHFVLGGGSNVLLTGDYDGIVIHNEITGITVAKETEEDVTLTVGSGEAWHPFVVYCVDRGWGGVENLSLIPGTVGAAPMQNIGAYGVEIKDVIVEVEAIDLTTGVTKKFPNRECKFGYRESIFKQQYRDASLISSVTLTLTKKNHKLNTSYGAIGETLQQMGVNSPTIKSISDAVIHIRRSKLPDPAVIGNAGSFFKNPSIEAEFHAFLKKTHPSMPSYPGENGKIKIAAGWLIEQCGWKGKRFDSIGVHPLQALVLVNYGDGKGEMIWQLAMEIQASVQEKFNITLQPEVNII